MPPIEWSHRKKKHVIFFSNSLSSLEVIHTFRTKDPLVLAIENKLMNLGGLADLAYVFSHTGEIGNEKAGVLAKEDSSLGVTKIYLPLPKYYVKNVSKSKFYPAGNLTGIKKKIEPILIT